MVVSGYWKKQYYVLAWQCHTQVVLIWVEDNIPCEVCLILLVLCYNLIHFNSVFGTALYAKLVTSSFYKKLQMSNSPKESSPASATSPGMMSLTILSSVNWTSAKSPLHETWQPKLAVRETVSYQFASIGVQKLTSLLEENMLRLNKSLCSFKFFSKIFSLWYKKKSLQSAYLSGRNKNVYGVKKLLNWFYVLFWYPFKP